MNVQNCHWGLFPEWLVPSGYGLSDLHELRVRHIEVVNGCTHVLFDRQPLPFCPTARRIAAGKGTSTELERED